jgi:hypothetical protein
MLDLDSTEHGRIITTWWDREIIVAYLKTLFRHSHGQSEENHEIIDPG